MKTALETVGNAAATLSASSVAMKRKLERARWTALGLAVVAAILGAVTAAVIEENDPWRWAFAFATALALGLGPWLTAHFLGQNQATRWIAVRAAAEALKREVYRRAARCKPYDGPAQEADIALIKEKQEIEADLGDVEEMAAESMDLPKSEIDLNTYVTNRVENQISWLRRRAGDHARRAATLRAAEIVVALIGVVLSAAGAAFGDTFSAKYLAPFIGVVTTVSTALIAHIEAGRYDFIAAMYRATAKRLENEQASHPPTTPLPDFVDKCEAILSAENSAWMAKFLKQ
jgi:MFS family permease